MSRCNEGFCTDRQARSAAPDHDCEMCAMHWCSLSLFSVWDLCGKGKLPGSVLIGFGCALVMKGNANELSASHH